jgi:5-methylcytosine-specific restriction endonuclease McrA
LDSNPSEGSLERSELIVIPQQMSQQKSIYMDHLESPYWKAVRKLVIARDGGKCALCNVASDLVVHHRTYAHVFHEMEHLGDLTTLCRPCHEMFHREKSKKRKATRKKRRKVAMQPAYLSDALDMP